jgi:uncharacterized protein YndB with AHSA1/START domain
MTEPVSISRRIEAPAAAIFAILADPERHPELDGSRMLCEPVDPRPMLKVGDTFVMRMHNDFMGDYVMANHVTEFEQDRRIAWAPELAQDPGGELPPHFAGHVRGNYRWSYELTPDGDSATVVTETYDCSGAPDALREFVRDGQIWCNSMKRSLEKLERLSTGQA